MSDINGNNNSSFVTRNRAKRISVRLAECALFVVLMVVSAFIQIPFPLVPLSFQTVVAVSAGLLLGPWWGSAAVLIYLFMGLLGLPVFTGGGGFAYILNLTFGYIIGFVFAALVAGIVRGNGQAKLWRLIVAAICGFLANYLIGIPYFALIWHFYMGNGELLSALLINNILYMPKDFALSIVAAFLARAVMAALPKR